MKNITLLLFAFTMMASISGVAQIAIPTKDSPDTRKTDYISPITPFKIFPVDKGASESTLGMKLTGPNTRGSYYRDLSFDPAWADQFQTVLDNLINISNVPGGSLAVFSPGQGLFYGVSGISHENVPITPDMRFGIGSNTKLFITVALLKLQEDGFLSLEDSLHQWLSPIPYIDSSVTIRQMLKHQSGFFDYFNDNPSLITDSVWADTSRFWTVPEVLATIGSPHFTPGTGWRYSNTNYMLAGEIIDSASGMSWVDYIHDAIFDPLVMDSTFIGAYEPRNGPVAAEWDASSGEVIINSPMTAQYSMMHAAGGILAVAQEMVSWYDALFEGELLSEASMQELVEFEPIMSYGLGIWGTQIMGKPAYTHTGGTLGYLSMMWYDVDSKTVMCILYNGREAVAEQFNALLEVLYDDFPVEENDAGIDEIITPWSTICDASVLPMVVLKNFGSDPLSSVTINYNIDDEPASILNWSGTLNAGDTVHLQLNQSTPAEGTHTFTCYTSQPNGQEEGYSFNDTARSNFIVNTQVVMPAPLTEGFEGDVFPPEGWTLGSNAMLNWRENFVTALSGEGTAMKNNYHDASFGFHYNLDLPLLNISGGDNPALYFSYAYAKYPGNNYDSLQVLISSDCGNSWSVLFNKGGLALSTAVNTYDPFYPETAANWKHESFPLDDYQGDVLIRFRAVCGAGNNLYLDDVAVVYTTGDKEIENASQIAVYPNPTNGIINVQFTVYNLQSVSVKIYDLHGREVATVVARQFPPGVHEVKFDASPLPPGIYIYRISNLESSVSSMGKLVVVK